MKTHFCERAFFAQKMGKVVTILALTLSTPAFAQQAGCTIEGPNGHHSPVPCSASAFPSSPSHYPAKNTASNDDLSVGDVIGWAVATAVGLAVLNAVIESDGGAAAPSASSSVGEESARLRREKAEQHYNDSKEDHYSAPPIGGDCGIFGGVHDVTCSK